MPEPLKSRILRHNTPTPRYTSYPPAPFFEDIQSDSVARHWLQSLRPGQSLSLYVHIPFCAQLCYYCGCHTTIANKYERIVPYLEQLRAEISLASQNVTRDTHVTHIHFGGGSPTILTEGDFASLLDHIRACFQVDPDAEIAIEADPRQLNRDKIRHYAACGITRLSLGAQDFNDDVLQAVNRPQPFSLSADAIDHARAAGIGGINLDIMYGLPLQTLATQQDTLQKVIALKPDRVSYFGYAHVPWMKRHMDVLGEHALPDADLRYDLFETGRRMLTQVGYGFIGIDHFVTAQDPMFQSWTNRTLRRNFQGYTTDGADALIGFGASAISNLPQGYMQNMRDGRAYGDAVAAGRLPVAKGYALTSTDKARGDIIADLMCYGEADLKSIARRHKMADYTFEADCSGLSPLISDGLVTYEDGIVRVHHGMPFIARLAAKVFDTFGKTGEVTQRHAAAV